MTLLLIFLMYWPDYRENFVIMSKDDPFRSLFASQNASWAIVAYGFATTQTAEGSVKKGLLRMAGTVTGALSAWLALVACEDDSYTFHYNTYGIVAWLTITSFLATYISTERGFAARVSLSNDYAFGPIYFVITQVIIVTYGYYYFEKEFRYEITINRMMANLVGISVAVVLAVIPPGIWGGNPRHCRSIVSLHWSKLLEVIEIMLSCSQEESSRSEQSGAQRKYEEAANQLRELSNQIQSQSSKMQAMAVDFEKDASKLHKMPRFQVDSRLKVEIAKVTRDIHISAFVPLLAANILQDDEKRASLVDNESPFRKELGDLFNEMNKYIDSTPATNVSMPLCFREEKSSVGDVDMELLVRTIIWLKDEMNQHKEVLGSIKWGF